MFVCFFYSVNLMCHFFVAFVLSVSLQNWLSSVKLSVAGYELHVWSKEVPRLLSVLQIVRMHSDFL